MLRRASTFLRNHDGVSAVEFALILPLMIATYLGAVELSNALNVDRRVTSVTSSVADLVAQTDEITCDEINDVFTAGAAIMAPYSGTPIEIVVTSVEADKDNNTKVGWSKALNGTAKATGSEYALPEGLTQAYSSIIVSEVKYTYTSTIGQYFTGGVTLTDTFYLRPRRSLTVTLTC